MTDPWTNAQPPTSPPGGYPQYPPPGYGPPPPPYAGAPYPPMVVPPPPRKSHTTAIVLSVVGGVIVLVLAVCGITTLIGGKAVHDDQIRADHDVKITNCTTQQVFDSQTGVATVSVTNSGSGRASYSVEVAFESQSGGTQYDTAYATVADLAPGQSATAEADGFTNITGGMKCAIISVTRI